jgi:hypothetical protein
VRLLRLEIERSLRRRMVWGLLAVALVGILLIVLTAFLSSAGATLAELQRPGDAHPAVMRTWWVAGTGDGVILVCGVFLMMGGLLGGAGVVGGEWRTGSLATTLTWEPRRTRLLMTRLAAMAICAFVIALLLQIVLLLALLPVVLANGTTAGVDGAFAVSLVAAMARIAVITSLAATLAGCVASIGRSTAGAIVAVWVWLALVETLLRARKPWSGAYLLGENVASVVAWARPVGMVHGRGPAAALAARVFQRTDVIAA